MRLLLITFLTAISVAALLTACRPSDEKSRLQQADMMFDSQPDSAFAIVRSIDPARLSGAYEQNLCRLLLTEGQVRLQLPCPDDSLIRLANRYFRKHGTAKQRMKSYFYLSRVRYNNGQLRKAANPAFAAHDLSKEIPSDFWKARCAELLADLYTETQLFSHAEYYWRTAITHYINSHHLINERYLLCDLAINRSNQGYFNEALHLLDSISTIADREKDTTLTSYAVLPKLSILSHLGDFTRAAAALDTIMSIAPQCITTPEYLSYQSSIYLNCGNTDMAYNIIRAADSISKGYQDKAYVFKQYVNFYNTTGQYNLLHNYIDSITENNKTMLEILMQQSMLNDQSDYFRRKHRRSEYESKKLSEFIIIIAVFSAIALFLSFMLYRSKLKIKDLELNRKIKDIKTLSEKIIARNTENKSLKKSIQERTKELSIAIEDIELYESKIKDLNTENTANKKLAQELKSTIENHQKIIDSLKADIEQNKIKIAEDKIQIEHLFRKRWEMFNRICDEFINLQDSPNLRVLISKYIENEIAEFSKDKNIRKIEDQVNLYMDDIINRLRQQCDFVKPNEIKFLTLIFAGFSAKAVSLFTGYKHKYIYTKKDRIQEKIEKSGVDDAHYFVTKMDKPL